MDLKKTESNIPDWQNEMMKYFNWRPTTEMVICRVQTKMVRQMETMET